LRLVAAFVVLAGAVATGAAVGLSAGSASVAFVDGTDISREAYDQYARVFMAPAGTLSVSEEDVLLSLVNQVIVQREADRRGIVIAAQDVSGAISAMDHSDHPGDVMLLPPNVDEDPGFRERVRMFLVFRLVKADVVGSVEIPDAALEDEYQADPRLHDIELGDAVPVLRERLIRRESDRRWAAWLRRQRACADIRIVDGSFDLPSSTPAPGCPATAGG
jgi:hypothetical protein